ncbi:hypothetical protein KXQ82_09795 [Mucilaginibacter sp. HMF5004]|nr:hypothetical protein [Mucilaginibacter rivuli]MBW4890010.1 hypothetical protein [Mucilaginibacter rivuli]
MENIITQNNDQPVKENWSKPEIFVTNAVEDTLGSTVMGGDGSALS